MGGRIPCAAHRPPHQKEEGTAMVNAKALRLRLKKTLGNLNNHIGVPLTLLNFDKNTEIGIVEMGANHIGEINFLCEIAKPTHGVITNFG